MMMERTDSDWTVLETQDLHDESFKLAHFHSNAHVSLSIPHNRLGFHTRQLARGQCRELGTRLLRFARTGQLTEPQIKDDFQI